MCHFFPITCDTTYLSLKKIFIEITWDFESCNERGFLIFMPQFQGRSQQSRLAILVLDLAFQIWWITWKETVIHKWSVHSVLIHPSFYRQLLGILIPVVNPCRTRGQWLLLPSLKILSERQLRLLVIHPRPENRTVRFALWILWSLRFQPANPHCIHSLAH